jgi:hypothetical protein
MIPALGKNDTAVEFSYEGSGNKDAIGFKGIGLRRTEIRREGERLVISLFIILDEFGGRSACKSFRIKEVEARGVEPLFIRKDGFPGEEFADGVVQVLGTGFYPRRQTPWCFGISLEHSRTFRRLF